MTITPKQFEHWLAFMDDALRRFFGGLPQELRDRLDYSLESLDALEDWLLKAYPSEAEILKPGHAQLLDGLARYAPKATPEAPVTLVTAALDRRKGNYIRKVLQAIQEELRNR